MFDHQRKSPNRTIIRKEKEGPKVYEPKEQKSEPPKESEESDSHKRREEPEGRHARNNTPAGTRKIAKNETEKERKRDPRSKEQIESLHASGTKYVVGV